MKMPGYCEKCHKIRTVRVTRPLPHRNVQTGICSACEEEQDRERRQRYETRRKQT